MRQISLFLLVSFLSLGAIQAQNFSCTAGERSLEQYAKHPELLVAKAQLDAFTKEFIRQGHASPKRSGGYVIPVVFHILHDAGIEDISDSLIFVEMQHWNEYMSATNAELSTTSTAFDTLIGNPQVEFRLAQKDPQGNCTNGIERIYTQSTYVGNNNTKLNPWPREKYLNVWLCRAVERDATNYGVLAYSMYPSSVASYVNNDIIDGIIAKYFVVGANDAFSRPTLAHECGHWMNLKHVWGDTNSPGVSCGDDDVNDTPITKGVQNLCSPNRSVCNPPIIENEQNIMNYSQCHFMFTKGQVDRMQAALSAQTSGRDSIWSATNLAATGTDVANPVSCAAPIAEYATNKRFVCAGQDVTFTDVSYNATIQNRNWTFPTDASATSTTDVKPIVNFSTPGWKQVTLEVDNNNGTTQKIKSQVYVTDASLIAAPYFETFENQATSQANWIPLNYDNNNTSFQYITGVGHYSNACWKLNTYNSHYDGDIDELVSPAYDLSNVSNANLKFSFEYSFATIDINHINDTSAGLAVYASTNCGNTWNLLYNKIGYGLFNAGVVSGYFVPQQDDQYWKKITLTLPLGYQTSGVNFKIAVTSARDINHFYLENINVGQAADPTGINETAVSFVQAMDIVPNPTQGDATIIIDAQAAANATVKVYDMAGREVANLYNGAMESGVKKIDFPTDKIASGVYVVKVSDSRSSTQKRFVKL